MMRAIVAAAALCVAIYTQDGIAGIYQDGIASTYGGPDGLCGSRTANGERVNCAALTAAHRALPFNTRVVVTNTANGRSVTVRINDRGPYVRGRVIDLTPAAARAIGSSGLAHVTLAVAGR